MHRDTVPTAGLINELTGIVSRAAGAILAVRASALKARLKPDQSPVTAADEAAEAIILEGLARTLPGVTVVSEEATGATPPQRLDDTFVLVDPLDGTRELVAGRDEFSVNVALVSGGVPRLGIIAAPAFSLIWRTGAGSGAERLRLRPGSPASAAGGHTTIRTRAWPAHRIVAAVSRSHLDQETRAFLAKLGANETIASGSAIKLCRVAEGAADIYPRLGTVHEWDVAAGDAIIAAAGGIVTAPDGAPLCYGRLVDRFLVRGFMAWGDASAAERLRT